MTYPVKLKSCDGCGKDGMIWKNHEGKRYCKKCWGAHAPVKQPNIISKKRLPPRSSKRVKLDTAYKVLRKVFLKTHPMCQAHLGGCMQYSSDVHHKKGRGEYYLDTTTWLAVCRICHDWIETHPKEAKEKGLSENRL